MAFPVLRLLASLLIPASLCAAAPGASSPLPIPPLLESYVRVTTGTFSSLAQHRADPAYAEVEVHVVRIWPERADGVWLYQEQAILSGTSDREAARARPYFQRVSRISAQPDGTLLRETFALRDPGRFVGLWRGDHRGPALTPADLGEAGCPIRIEAAGHGHFAGTSGACPNRHRGASAMRSVSVIAPDRFVNWDRGFDRDGRLVWGPEAGGYVFVRVED
jgi:hypothetical protein